MVRLESIVLFGCLLHHATHGSMLRVISANRVRPTMLSGSNHVDLTTTTVSLAALPGLVQLGPGSSFRKANGLVHKSAKGVKRVRLIQTYGGYDVMGSSVAAEVMSNEGFSGHVYGEAVRNIHDDIPDPEACQRDVGEFLGEAIRREGLCCDDPDIQNRDGRRVIMAYSKTSRARLAYEVKFFYKGRLRLSYPVYIFDACTGDVLMKHDQIMSTFASDTVERLQELENVQTNGTLVYRFKRRRAGSCARSVAGLGGNVKVGRRTYNTPPYCLTVRKVSSACQMQGTYTKVIDNKGSTSSSKTSRVLFICSRGYSDAVNGAYGVANDASYHGEMFGRFFREKYDMVVLNYITRLVVHFDRNLDNAYSDGRDSYFGDGNNVFYPLVDIDIVAHEIAHAITSQNSRLVYKGMSGGINEAFSDITSVAVRAFQEDTQNPEWSVGAAVYKRDGALRYFDKPRRDGKSIDHVLRYRTGMNVHYSSGVFNHAFYKLVRTQRMDIFQAYKCFLDANLNLWRPNTNFFSGACNVMQAAFDNGFNHRKVRRAFRHVGIPLFICWYAALSTSMYVGETRDEILVSETRSPVIKVELGNIKNGSTTVEASTGDGSVVHIVVGRDNEATKVLTKGDSVVTFDNSYKAVYVMMTSTSKNDVKAKMTVSSTETIQSV